MLTCLKGREPGDVFGPDLVSLGAELAERRIHVDRVPEHDEVDHEPNRAELVLLALAVALAELAPLANNLRRAGFFGDRFLDGFMRENVSLEHRPAKFHRCSIKPGFVAKPRPPPLCRFSVPLLLRPQPLVFSAHRSVAGS